MEKAQKVRKKLNAKNFSKVASEETENAFAKADEGKIGVVSWIDQRVKYMGWRPLVETAFKMKKGKISNPIVTGEGVHIIQVASDKQTQSFEDSSTYLRTQFEADVKKELMEQMLKEIKIEYLDPSLAPEKNKLYE